MRVCGGTIARKNSDTILEHNECETHMSGGEWLQVPSSNMAVAYRRPEVGANRRLFLLQFKYIIIIIIIISTHNANIVTY